MVSQIKKILIDLHTSFRQNRTHMRVPLSTLTIEEQWKRPLVTPRRTGTTRVFVEPAPGSPRPKERPTHPAAPAAPCAPPPDPQAAGAPKGGVSLPTWLVPTFCNGLLCGLTWVAAVHAKSVPAPVGPPPAAEVRVPTAPAGAVVPGTSTVEPPTLVTAVLDEINRQVAMSRLGGHVSTPSPASAADASEGAQAVKHLATAVNALGDMLNQQAATSHQMDEQLKSLLAELTTVCAHVEAIKRAVVPIDLTTHNRQLFPAADKASSTRTQTPTLTNTR